jgi:hypothetical protein
MRTLILIPIIISLLGGCSNAMEFDDVSAEGDFSYLIEKEVKILNEARLIGITLEPNYEPIIAYYSIRVAPFGGAPEIVSSEKISAGTIFSIKSVQRCNNCLPIAPAPVFLWGSLKGDLIKHDKVTSLPYYQFQKKHYEFELLQ